MNWELYQSIIETLEILGIKNCWLLYAKASRKPKRTKALTGKRKKGIILKFHIIFSLQR